MASYKPILACALLGGALLAGCAESPIKGQEVPAHTPVAAASPTQKPTKPKVTEPKEGQDNQRPEGSVTFGTFANDVLKMHNDKYVLTAELPKGMADYPEAAKQYSSGLIESGARFMGAEMVLNLLADEGALEGSEDEDVRLVMANFTYYPYSVHNPPESLDLGGPIPIFEDVEAPEVDLPGVIQGHHVTTTEDNGKESHSVTLLLVDNEEETLAVNFQIYNMSDSEIDAFLKSIKVTDA